MSRLFKGFYHWPLIVGASIRSSNLIPYTCVAEGEVVSMMEIILFLKSLETFNHDRIDTFSIVENQYNEVQFIKFGFGQRLFAISCLKSILSVFLCNRASFMR